MSKDLAKFDELKADVSLYVAPVLTMEVRDFKTSEAAIEARKTIRRYMADLEKKRKELTAPLDAQIKMIRAYAKGIEDPLLKAEQHILFQLNRFAEEQERIRVAKQRAIEEARREAERKAEEDRKRLEDELEARRQAELEALASTQEQSAESASFWGGDAPTVDVEAEAAAIDEKLERERVEAEARAERERIQRESDAKQAEWDANQYQIKGARKTWDYEVTDINQIPKEFLIVTVNKQAVLATIRAGVKIPGIRAFQKMGVPSGSNTRVTLAAIESEEDASRAEEIESGKGGM